MRGFVSFISIYFDTSLPAFRFPDVLLKPAFVIIKEVAVRSSDFPETLSRQAILSPPPARDRDRPPQRKPKRSPSREGFDFPPCSSSPLPKSKDSSRPICRAPSCCWPSRRHNWHGSASLSFRKIRKFLYKYSATQKNIESHAKVFQPFVAFHPVPRWHMIGVRRR